MRFAAILMLTLLLNACTPSSEKRSDEVLLHLGRADSLLNENPGDTTSLTQAKQAVNDYVAAFPQDSLSPQFLLNLGLLYHEAHYSTEAVQLLSKVYDRYPESREAGRALFSEAFIYAEELKDLDKARALYEQYLKQYGNQDEKMTRDVEMQLKYLGMDAEQMLEEIQKANQPDTTASV